MARKQIDYNSFLLASSNLRFIQSDDGYKVFYGLKKKSQPWLGGAAILISLWFFYSGISPSIHSLKNFLLFFLFVFVGIYLCAGRKEMLAINNETLTSRLGLQKRTVPINAVKLLYCEKVKRGKGERYVHRIRAVVTNAQGINLFEFPEQEVAEAVRVKLHQCLADVRKDWAEFQADNNMSPEAIDARLKMTSELLKLCLSLGQAKPIEKTTQKLLTTKKSEEKTIENLQRRSSER